jgi:PTS system D-glucosamine-specific IIC component
MDYIKTAKEILSGIGGYENIVKISHCSTRLRFQLMDESKVKDYLIKSIPGVYGIVRRGLQYQVVLGPEVVKVYHQLKKGNNDNIQIDRSIHYDKESKVERDNSFSRKRKYEKGGTQDKKNQINIVTPVNGEIRPICEVNDPAFASEIIGKGIAVMPEDGMVYAPFDGTVITIFSTLHALCLLSDQGVELLIHIGINTVRLNGAYFKAYVNPGDKIKKGELMLEYDLKKLQEIGYDTVVPIVITNSDHYKDISYTQNPKVRKGDIIIEITNEINKEITN